MSKWDYLIASVITLTVAFLTLGTWKGKGRDIPLDDRHHPSFQALNDGRNRAEVELLCTTCHSKSSLPLPKSHPPKEQCLICHKIVSA